MKQYLRFFRIPFIITLALFVVAVIVSVVSAIVNEPKARSNQECTTTERVFDYADVLTDEEENSLREVIAKTELKTESDIVIVTLNESLVDYAAQYEDKIGRVSTDKCVMVYADNFYEEHKFGYNKANGDGVLLLDNWYREADGHVYSWMCTTGKIEDAYSSEMIDTTLNASLATVDTNPYFAYKCFVDLYARDMEDTSGSIADLIHPFFIFLLALIVAVIFLIANLSWRKGKVTVNETTYVAGGRPTMKRKEDNFLYKNVTKRRIETSSGGSGGGGGGGGGHHTSSSGGSHGGGGHSR